MKRNFTPLTLAERNKLHEDLERDLAIYGACVWKRDATGRAVRIDPTTFYKEPTDG